MSARNTSRPRIFAPILILAALHILVAAGCQPKSSSGQPGEPAAPPDPGFTLEDATAKAGIDFVHNNGASGLKLLPEALGSGVGFIDYDHDLDPDLVVVNGRDWSKTEMESARFGMGHEGTAPLPTSPARGGTCRLYQNNGDGTFIDVTAGSGLDVSMFGMGVAVGDYDGDERDDLFITSTDRSYLFHNDGPGKFRDVSEKAGVKGAGWSAGAAFLDYDRDGRLDLFVGRFVEWSPAKEVFTSVDGRTKCHVAPEHYNGLTDRLYRNMGGGRFQDVSEKAGISGRAGSPGLRGKSLGAAVVDQDGDEWLDIAVANNTDPNYLYRNNGRGAFREIGMEAGIALSADGSPRAAFGIDSAEIAELGGESLLFGHLNGQMPALYQRDRGGLFQDATSESGTGPASRPYTSFGTAFADLDNDGRPDILAVNGHLDPDVQQFQGDISYRQPPLFFLNQGGGRFAEAGRALGADFARPLAGRGLALADFDLDGNLDVAITTNGGPLHLLRNRGKSGANAIRLVLEGAGGNRSAIGAWVEVKAGMSTIRRRVKSGGSYLSQSELPLTIGLGEHPMADSVTVHWPGRSKTSVKEVAAGQIVQIQEGAGIVGSRPFRKVP